LLRYSLYEPLFQLAGVVPGCRVVEVGGAVVGTFDAASAALAMFRICGDNAVPIVFDLFETPDANVDYVDRGAMSALNDRVSVVAAGPETSSEEDEKLREAFGRLDLDGTGNLHKVTRAPVANLLCILALWALGGFLRCGTFLCPELPQIAQPMPPSLRDWLHTTWQGARALSARTTALCFNH
jgi:hypothetical protein